MKKIFLFLIFSSFVFCNQNEKSKIEIIDNSIDNSNDENKIYENSGKNEKRGNDCTSRNTSWKYSKTVFRLYFKIIDCKVNG